MCSSQFFRTITFDVPLSKMSLIKVDFPLPETPVTSVNLDKGIATVIFLSYFLAPIITISFPIPLRLLVGTSILYSPVKYLPVNCLGFS